jgi:hypothetical protein
VKAVNGDRVPEHACAAGPADPSCCATCGTKLAVWMRQGRGYYALFRGRTKLGYVESDDSKWVAVVIGDDRAERLWDSTDRKTLRDAKAWVEERTR